VEKGEFYFWLTYEYHAAVFVFAPALYTVSCVAVSPCSGKMYEANQNMYETMVLNI